MGFHIDLQIRPVLYQGTVIGDPQRDFVVAVLLGQGLSVRTDLAVRIGDLHSASALVMAEIVCLMHYKLVIICPFHALQHRNIELHGHCAVRQPCL